MRSRALLLSLLLAACQDVEPPIAQSQHGVTPSTTPSGDRSAAERVRTRLHTIHPGKLRQLLSREGVDVTGSHHRMGFVDILSTKKERDRLLLRLKSRFHKWTNLGSPKATKALSDYLSPTEVAAFLDQVINDYPNITKRVELASGLPEGGTIYALKISDNPELDENEPRFLMDGQMHPREVMTPEIVVHAIDYLTSNYDTDTQVQRWVDNLEIWMVPVVNPDGAAYVHAHDSMWRKNRSHNCGSDVGVDLNRNFEWNWNGCSGSSSICSEDTYRGPSAASEPETQALQSLMEALRPLYYLTYHSYGEYILWPSSCGHVEEHEMLSQVGEELNAVVQNDSGQTGQWTTGTATDVMYSAPGGSDDHAYGATGAITITMEVNSTDFQPNYAAYRDATVERQRAAWGHLMDRSLDGPSVRGRIYDASSSEPVQASFTFANHPFTSGQWQLSADAHGRYGRVVPADSHHTIVFTAPGYLPATHSVDVAQGPFELDVPMQQGTNHAPVAVVGSDQTVDEGSTVTLDATGSSDPDGNTLVYLWQQTAGPEVQLDDAYGVSPSFFASSVDADATATFELRVTDGELTSNPETVNIVIQDRWHQTSTFPSTDTPQGIPDNNATGITSIIHIAEDNTILQAKLHLDITHSYVGDLRVTLTSPTGTEAVVHDNEGGSNANLVEDYTLPEFAGENSVGDWRLHIVDTEAQDSGTLNEWALYLDLMGPSCSTPADCSLPHTSVHTCDGACGIETCEQGYADCNQGAGDGCEVDIETSLSHCGSCGNTCTLPQATMTCQAGSCVFEACEASFGDCNQDPSDGCETNIQDDVTHCGGCGQACVFPQADAACVQGSCKLGACLAGWADCDLDGSNGCESELSSDELNCGTCGTDCTTLPHASGACVTGICQVGPCEMGFADCNDITDDGCETSIASDPEHCGSCGSACDLPNASATCAVGACEVDVCATGFLDCNLVAEDGCESESSTDPQNCGQCGVACAANESCKNGVCVCANDSGVCSDAGVADGGGAVDAGAEDSGTKDGEEKGQEGDRDEGCGCRAVGGSSRHGAWELVLLAFMLTVGKRFRRSCRGRSHR